MRGAQWLALAAVCAVACRQAPAAFRPQQSLGAEGAFTTEVTVTRFAMLPADPSDPMAGTSRFGVRCSTPATWVAAFDIEGTLPELGRFTGTASHCSQVTQGPQGPEATYGAGRAWLRTAAGDILLLHYDNGAARPPDAAGYSLWRDEWRVVGGSGRFAAAAGAGVDSGSVHMATLTFPPYVMRGELEYARAYGEAHSPFSGRIDGEWTLPYLVSGDSARDPCRLERGGDWVTGELTARGTATHLGTFTIRGRSCRHRLSGEAVPAPVAAVTASGDTLHWSTQQALWDFPVLAPGLDRAYSFLERNRMSGMSGRLVGMQGEFWAAGTMELRWSTAGTAPSPILPWPVHAELSGWYDPPPRTR